MVRATTFVAACLAAAIVADACRAGPADDALSPFAVHVMRTPRPDWTGAGVYLGDGLVLTAAHVVGRSWLTQPRVEIAGVVYSGRAIKEGDLEATDLTLLAIDTATLPQRMRLRRLAVCSAAPWPGEEVVTITPEAIAASRVLAPETLPREVRRFDTVIAEAPHAGNSGAGVIDVQRRCLLGIISRKISLPGALTDHGRAQARDIAKYFVPAAAIAAFLPPGTARLSEGASGQPALQALSSSRSN